MLIRLSYMNALKIAALFSTLISPLALAEFTSYQCADIERVGFDENFKEQHLDTFEFALHVEIESGKVQENRRIDLHEPDCEIRKSLTGSRITLSCTNEFKTSNFHFHMDKGTYVRSAVMHHDEVYLAHGSCEEAI